MDNTTTELISVREFARRVAVNESTIRGYVTSNRFTTGIQVDDKGIKKIVWPVAKTEWDRFGGGLDKDKKVQSKTARPGAQAATDPTRPTTALAQPKDEDDIPNINVSKAMSEHYKAQTAKLEYEKLQGTLVDKAAVYDALFRYGAALRSDLQSIPDRCVDAAMSAMTRMEAHAAIYNEIEAVLVKFTGDGAIDTTGEESDT